jgi:hypothetical protein
MRLSSILVARWGGNRARLANEVPVTVDTRFTIDVRRGSNVSTSERLSANGTINTAYLLEDELVQRVPRDHPAHVAYTHAIEIAIISLRKRA